MPDADDRHLHWTIAIVIGALAPASNTEAVRAKRLALLDGAADQDEP